MRRTSVLSTRIGRVAVTSGALVGLAVLSSLLGAAAGPPPVSGGASASDLADLPKPVEETPPEPSSQPASRPAAEGELKITRVLMSDVDGTINPGTKDHFLKSIEQAEKRGFGMVVFRLDTPGGLLDSTRDIVKGFMAARIPVAVLVAPSGARAASAGAFITMAAHVAAMAPSTNIGAAHPVSVGGGAARDRTTTPSTWPPRPRRTPPLSSRASPSSAIATRRGRARPWSSRCRW
ncbi:MAG: hypothetical protein ABIJ09_23970 [Pseudomonadota bacterium]